MLDISKIRMYIRCILKTSKMEAKYKIGQKVKFNGCEGKITSVKWNPFVERFDYSVSYKGQKRSRQARGINENRLR